MSSPLDMTLDEIIRKNQRSRGHNSHFRGKVTGPDRHAPYRHLRKTVPYEAMQVTVRREAIPLTGQQSKMCSHGGISTDTETKLYISNLDYDVSDRDIEMLFSSVGELKSHTIHYDRSGRSKGTGEVLFYRQVDAQAALRKFNNARLDGKPLKIELVGVQLVAPDPMRPTKNHILENWNGGFISGQGRVGAEGWVRGACSTGGGRGMARGHGQRQGQGNPHDKMLAAKKLDTDLDKYRSEAMRIE